ncbi:hypothetical protein BS329_04100 [Amycolatopsis coloradensis]|uniref:CU044_5270 family protein n=1 Tax=Amycolatopsis coloradensis TaxID=76021 RepID=A0A1R0L073_9PSEU|nr:CU044_5270 family protein [Amycolatopsis coloradensis]OLZ55207.1 hypothetical protein BS329_04100 [Amycolatopsis coloradensis]
MPGGSIRKVWSDAELDQALADLRSGPEVRQDELSRAKAALLRAAGEVEDEALPMAAPPARKRPGSWRWIAAAAAAALVSGGAIVVTNVFVGDDGQDTAAHHTAAAPDMDPLKDLRGADLPLTGQQYWLSTESTWKTWIGKKSGVIYQTRETTERWLPSDWALKHMTRVTRTGEIRWFKGDYETARAKGEAIPGATVTSGWEGPGRMPTGGPAAGPTTTSSPPGAPVSTQRDEPPRSNWLLPSKEFLEGLPTDPAKLLERLREANKDGKVNAAPEMYDMALSVMRSSHGYSDLRVALCKALAKAPGITLETNVTTPDKRPAISFTVRETDQIRTFVVDLATAHLAGHNAERNRSDPGFPGLSIHDTTVTTQITDRAGP